MARPSAPSHATLTQDLPLRDIAVDPDLQVRFKEDRRKIEGYTSAYRMGHVFPPLLVASSGKGYVLLDGFHRLTAAMRADIDKLSCKIIWAEPEEWPWLAAEANLGHGLPYKRSEHREVFRRYVRAGKHRKGSMGFKSYREIALEALKGVRGHTTVYNWMNEDFPGIAKAMSGGELVQPEVPLNRWSAVDDAVEAVEEARRCALTLTNPVERTRVVSALRALITELEALGLASDPDAISDEDLPF